MSDSLRLKMGLERRRNLHSALQQTKEEHPTTERVMGCMIGERGVGAERSREKRGEGPTGEGVLGGGGEGGGP